VSSQRPSAGGGSCLADRWLAWSRRLRRGERL